MEIQAAISKVRGIIANRVVFEGEGIAEVHVLAGTDRQAKQIVRDVESLCAAEFGIRIDHRKVSVALIDTPVEREQFQRPQIRGMRVETLGSRLEVHVALAVGQDIYEGMAEGIAVNRNRLAAFAALNALEEYLRGSCHLVLEDLVPFHLGEWEGYLAGVVLLSSFAEEHLVGSALVKKDHLEAVVKATCNAVNRRIRTVSGEGRQRSHSDLEVDDEDRQ